jgi:hypothetical protein
MSESVDLSAKDAKLIALLDEAVKCPASYAAEYQTTEGFRLGQLAVQEVLCGSSISDPTKWRVYADGVDTETTEPIVVLESGSEVRMWIDQQKEERMEKFGPDSEVVTYQILAPREEPKKTREVLAKRYVSPAEVHSLAIQLAVLIAKQLETFQPDFIVVLWRGGAIFGKIVQGVLRSLGIKTDHIAVRTESYTAPGEQSSKVNVYGLNHVIDKCNRTNKVLFIDDVFESGRSIEVVQNKMKIKMRENMPVDIRVAVAFEKIGKNKTDIVPDYVVERTTEWLVFPHEIEDMSPEEVKANMGEDIYAMLYNSDGTSKWKRPKVNPYVEAVRLASAKWDAAIGGGTAEPSTAKPPTETAKSVEPAKRIPSGFFSNWT